MTYSERATPILYSSSIDIFRLSLTVLKLFDFSFWLGKAYSEPFWGVLGVKLPPNFEICKFNPRKALPYVRPRFLSYCARKSVHGYGLESILRCEKQKKKVTGHVH